MKKIIFTLVCFLFMTASAYASCSWVGNTGTVQSPYDATEFASCVTGAATKTGEVTIELPAQVVTKSDINMSAWTTHTKLIVKGQGSSSTTLQGGLWTITGNSAIEVEIYGMKITTSGGGRSITLNGCQDTVLIHDNIVKPLDGTSTVGIVYFENNSSCYHANGVVYNNTFYNTGVHTRGNISSTNRNVNLSNLWAQSPDWGNPPSTGFDPTSASYKGVIYVEGNIFYSNINGLAMDHGYAGRNVFRFNTLIGTPPTANQAHYFEDHSLENVNDIRGSQFREIYKNYIDNQGPGTLWFWLTLSSGTGPVWGNKLKGYYGDNNVDMFVHRLATAAGILGKCDGTHTGTVDGSGTGDYPCRDQIGVGYDASSWTHPSGANKIGRAHV